MRLGHRQLDVLRAAEHGRAWTHHVGQGRMVVLTGGDHHPERVLERLLDLELLALGAEGVQLGTRFIATPEASVHPAYKEAVLKAGVGDTAFVGRGGHPIRQLRNAFSDQYAAAERTGASAEELEKLFAGATLKQAALDGYVQWGKVEAGQSAGLVDDILPAAELMRRLVAELHQARTRLNQGQTTISEAQ